MNNEYEKKLLTILVEGYRKSKKDTGANRTKRRTKLTPDKLYNKYYSNNGDYEKISSINDTVQSLKERGFVTADNESFGTELDAIYLVDDKVKAIEDYLSAQYGYVSKDTKLQKLQRLIETYENCSPICREECREWKEILKSRQMSKSIEKKIDTLDELLQVLAFVENNQTPLYIREVSMLVYGDSKYFEKNTLDRLCALLQKYNTVPFLGQTSPDEAGRSEEYMLPAEILKQYHVFKEPQKLSIRGKALIRIGGKDLDISELDEGIEFTVSEVSRIECVKLLAPVFMTIENRTSYLRYRKEDTVTFYLGGYANRHQRDFIRKIHESNPDAMYLHFGDIDAGGFWIHHHLCQITGVPFALFHMSSEELTRPACRNCLHPLTDQDEARLRELAQMPEYRDTVQYMLEHRVKLEQEIVSLELRG